MPINYGYNRDSVGALNLYGRPATGISSHVNGVGVDSNGNPYCVYTNTTVTTLRRAGLLWTVDGALVITYTDPGNTRIVNGFKVSAAGAVFVTTDTPTTTSSVTFDPILGSLMVSAAGAVHIQENWQSAPGSLTPNGFSLTRGSTGTYFDSAGLLQTASSNVARGTYRYNGLAWVFDGTLVEGAATNLALQSEDLTATWSLTAATVTSNAIAAPSGATTADYLIATAVSSTHLANQTVAVSSGAVYTLSAFLKAGGETTATLAISNSPFPRILFNLSTGAITSSQGGGTGTITNAGNGWYRCTCTFTAPAASITPLIAVRDIDANWTGNGVDGVYAWGAQLETGSAATSYIPTTTVAVTRSADVLTASTSGLLASAQGFAAIAFRPVTAPTTGNIIEATNLPMSLNAGQLSLNDGTAARDFLATALTVGTNTKLATTWGGSASNGAANGTLGTSRAFDGDMGLGATVTLMGGVSGVLQSLRLGKKPATSAELSEFTA